MDFFIRKNNKRICHLKIKIENIFIDFLKIKESESTV